MDQHFAAVRLLNEVIQHALGHFEVGDDAVLHRPDGDDVAGRAAQHVLGFFADGLDFAGVLVDGHDGGLVDHDALAFGEDQGVGGAQIDGQIGGEETEQGRDLHAARFGGTSRSTRVRCAGEPWAGIRVHGSA